MKRFTLILIVVFMLFGVEKIHEHKVEPKRTWQVSDSKAYARDMLSAWKDEQFNCLDKLWKKESNWRPEAYNKVKVMGRNAGGIPQLLGMLPTVEPTTQIDRGLDYIKHRYGTVCTALEHHNRKGWY